MAGSSLFERLDALLATDFANFQITQGAVWFAEMKVCGADLSEPVRGLPPQMHGLTTALGPDGIACAVGSSGQANALNGCQHAHALIRWAQSWKPRGSTDDALRMWVAVLAQTARVTPHLVGVPIQRKHLHQEVKALNQEMLTAVGGTASLPKRCTALEQAMKLAIEPSARWPAAIIASWGRTLISAAAYLEEVSFGSLSDSRKTAWNTSAAHMSWMLLQKGVALVVAHDPAVDAVGLGKLFQLQGLTPPRPRTLAPAVEFLENKPEEVTLWETWGVLMDDKPGPDGSLNVVWDSLENEAVTSASCVLSHLAARTTPLSALLRQKLLEETLPTSPPFATSKPRM